jgi:hypothetical protein
MATRKRNPELRPISNDIDDEQKAALFGKGIEKLEAAIRRKDEAVAGIRLQRKTMKSEGFSADEIGHALWLRKQEGDEPKEKIELEIRVARWLQRPLGLQADLFAA